MDADVLCSELVATMRAAGKVRTAAVERAFLTVRRHLFVPSVALDVAYHDDVIFTKSRDGVSLSACSQPSIVAEMLELLDVHEGHRVLEVGAGTGYNAALLEALAGGRGRVVTLDIDQDIVDGARVNLSAAGLGAAIDVQRGDGGFGWPAGVPYDRVIVTAGAWDVAPAWFEQLAVGGRLVVPVEFRDVHKLVTFERLDDRLSSRDVRDCRFVQLRGAFAGPERQIPLDGGGLYLSTLREAVDGERLAGLLGEPGRAVALPVPLSPTELHQGLRLWLALRSPDFCMLSLEGTALHRSTVRAWEVTPARTLRTPGPEARFASAPGLLDDAGLCLVERDADDERPVLRTYGDAAGVAARLSADLLAWNAAGRPFTSDLAIDAIPLADAGTAPVPDREPVAIVDKRWFRYVFARSRVVAPDVDG